MQAAIHKLVCCDKLPAYVVRKKNISVGPINLYIGALRSYRNILHGCRVSADLPTNKFMETTKPRRPSILFLPSKSAAKDVAMFNNIIPDFLGVLSSKSYNLPRLFHVVSWPIFPLRLFDVMQKTDMYGVRLSLVNRLSFLRFDLELGG